MTDPSASANTSSVPVEEQAIRERVRELTAQVLAGGPLNTEGVKEVVRTMSGGRRVQAAAGRRAGARGVRGGNQRTRPSAAEFGTGGARDLEALASHGKDFSDNDLKNAFAALQKLQEDLRRHGQPYRRCHHREHPPRTRRSGAARATGRRRRERSRRADDERVRQPHDATRTADAGPGIEAVREYGANMTMLTSGLLAGFADALRQQSESKKRR